MCAVFGIDEGTGGEIRVTESTVNIREPKDAMRAGIALVAKDRRGRAIVPMMSVEQNFGLANQRRFAWFGVCCAAAPAAWRPGNMLRIYRSDPQTS
jgi:ribose transport system ATP-binding protein